MRKLARIVSALTHPLFIPLAAVYIAYNFDWFINGSLSDDQIRIVYMIVAFSTLIFPLLNILLLKWYGVVSSLSMPHRAERHAPYISTIFFFALGYYMLRKGALPDAIFSILTGTLLTLALIAVINFKWKISAHAAGIFGLVGVVIGLFQTHSYGNITLLSLLVLVGGLVISSRLVLNAHTPAETYWGAGLGFVASYLCVYLGIFI